MYTDTLTPKDWNKLLTETGCQAGFCQTEDWAIINKTVNAIEPYWVSLKSNTDKLTAGCLLGYQSQTHTGWLTFVKKILQFGRQGNLQCYEGPILLENTRQLSDLEGILSNIEQLAQDLKVQNVHFAGRPPASIWPREEDTEVIFKKFGYIKAPWQTALVDLKESEETLFQKVHHSVRKGVKKCRELKVEITECQTLEEYMRDFHEPFFATRRTLGEKIPIDYKNRQWWALDHQKHYRYFVARSKDNQILGMLATYRFNGVATEIMSERTIYTRDLKLPIQDLLHWHVILKHQALGDHYFNLAGFNPSPKTAKEAGIKAFKEKWGGKIVEIPAFHKRFDGYVYRWLRHIKTWADK